MMMKYLRLIFAILVLIIIGSYSPDGEAAQKKVAVMPFQNVSGWHEQQVGEILTEQVTVALVNSGRYTVLERTQLGHVIRELNFQASGMVDPNQIIQFGKMSGTDYTIVGKVTTVAIAANDTRQVVEVFCGDSIGGMVAAYKGQVHCDIRFIDNATGQIIFARNFKGSACGNNHSVLLQQACRAIAAGIIRAVRGPLGATVIEREGSIVYIDKGRDEGLRVDEILIVYKEGSPIRRPDGRFFVKKIPIGRIRVIEAAEDYAVCKIMDNDAAITKNAKVGRMRKRR